MLAVRFPANKHPIHKHPGGIYQNKSKNNWVGCTSLAIGEWFDELRCTLLLSGEKDSVLGCYVTAMTGWILITPQELGMTISVRTYSRWMADPIVQKKKKRFVLLFHKKNIFWYKKKLHRILHFSIMLKRITIIATLPAGCFDHVQRPWPAQWCRSWRASRLLRTCSLARHLLIWWCLSGPEKKTDEWMRWWCWRETWWWWMDGFLRKI